MLNTQGVVSDGDLEAMRLRNESRTAEAIKQMGRKYCCHIANTVRKDPNRANFSPAQEPTQGVLELRSSRRAAK